MRNLLLYTVLILLSSKLFAQDITTMWPYLYPDFKTGTVYFVDKSTLTMPVNIHLLQSSLHFIENDQIKEASTSQIVLAQINHDTFYMRNNQLMRVVKGDSAGFVAELVVADFDAIKNTGGAYGSSSNVQATRKLSSLEIGGINITNHMELMSKKEEGSLLPLVKRYYIVTKHDVYLANRKSIESQLSQPHKASFNQFVKQNKINWKRPESLELLLGFLKDK